MRLFREWLATDVDFDWVVAYHRSHPLLRHAPYIVSATCFLLGTMVGIQLLRALADPTGSQFAIGLGISVVLSLVLGGYWAQGLFPSKSESLQFVVIGDIAIALALLSLPATPMWLMSAVLLVSIGNYANAMHGPRVFLLHEFFSLAVTAGLFIRLTSTTTTAVTDAISVLAGALVLMFGASTLNHLFFAALRDDAVRAYYDQLTGVRNRRGLCKAVDDLLRASREEGPLSISVIAIDLDTFKAVNDRHGHAAGDDVLRRTAERIDSKCTRGAVCARLGGEEFLVIEIRAGDPTPLLARNLIDAIHCPHDPVPVTASAGFAFVSSSPSMPDTVATFTSLVGRADLSMYEAKRRGGNQVACSPPDDGP